MNIFCLEIEVLINNIMNVFRGIYKMCEYIFIINMFLGKVRIIFSFIWYFLKI